MLSCTTRATTTSTGRGSPKRGADQSRSAPRFHTSPNTRWWGDDQGDDQGGDEGEGLTPSLYPPLAHALSPQPCASPDLKRMQPLTGALTHHSLTLSLSHSLTLTGEASGGRRDTRHGRPTLPLSLSLSLTHHSRTRHSLTHHSHGVLTGEASGGGRSLSHALLSDSLSHTHYALALFHAHAPLSHCLTVSLSLSHTYAPLSHSHSLTLSLSC